MKKLVLFAFAACLFAACAKEVPTVVEYPSTDSTSPAATSPAPVFYASVESGTRTFVDGLDVCWAAGDEISIFNRNSFNSEYVYAGEPGATSGAFNPVAVDSTDTEVPYVYAAYPYNKYSEIYEDFSLSLWFYPQQKYVPGTFDPASAVMVAASENENLKFRNACGFLKVRLWGDASAPVSMVYIQGNNGEIISGYRVVTVSPGEAPVSEPDTQYNTYEYVAVVDDSGSLYLGETAEDAVEFWLAIPPVSFTEGITLYVEDAKGGQFIFSTSTPLEIKRGVIKTTAPLEVTFTRIDWNYLGTGSLTDDIACPNYGLDPITVPCEVYEDADNPGIYKVDSFQKLIFEAVYEIEDGSPYEGYLYRNTGLVIDATDPAAVFFDYQDYGICFNTNDGFFGATSTYNGNHFSEGILENGVISFPTVKGLLCTIGEEGYYYTNLNGAFKIVLPSAASPAPALQSKASVSANGRQLKALTKRPDITRYAPAARIK